MAIFNPQLATWRTQFNPLIGLNMGRIVFMLNAAEMGYYSDLMWLYRFIEKRDATIKSVRTRRLAAIKKLQFSIKIKEGDNVDPDLATAQFQFLTDMYGKIDNLIEAFEFLALAEFRGYSHLEKHYDVEGNIIHLEPVPQWYWCRRFPSRDWLYNEKALQTTNGVPIDDDNFIVREVDCPINEIAVIAFIRKGMSQKDWDGFIETYGIPPLVIELPAGVGITEEYQGFADRVISDARGVIGNGSKVHTVDVGMRGQVPFQGHIAYQDQQIVMAATGGLLTALSQPTGMNDDQAKVHEKTFMDIAKGEAEDISEIFRKRLDIPALQKQFGEDAEICAYFQLAQYEVDERPDIIADATQLAQIGLAIDPAQITDYTGYNLSKIQPPAQGLGSAPGGWDEPDDGQDKQDMQNRKLMVKEQCKKIINAIRSVAKKDGSIRAELDQLINGAPQLV